MTPPWRLGKKPRYAEQEDRTGKKPGARKQMNSGRTWSALRDVKRVVGEFTFLYDNKTTESASFTVSEPEFRALKRDANRTPPGCLPVLQIDFGDKASLVVIEESLFDELCGRL